MDIAKNLSIICIIYISLLYQIKIQRALEGDSRMPKKAADIKFQIQNNLAPALQCFVIG